MAKKLYIVKEGGFKTNWRVKEHKAFTSRQAIHEFMENKLGFKCVRSDDQYSPKGTRFKNQSKYYGYDIITLEIYESPVVEETKQEVVIEVELDKMDDDAIRFLAKQNGIKSWHLKSRDKLIEEIKEKGFKVE